MLAQEVEESVRASGSAEIDAHDVGLAILTPLRRLDVVAYLRFASVYQAFEGLKISNAPSKCSAINKRNWPDSRPSFRTPPAATPHPPHDAARRASHRRRCGVVTDRSQRGGGERTQAPA